MRSAGRNWICIWGARPGGGGRSRAEKPPKALDIPKKTDEKLFGASGKDAKMLSKFRRFLGKTDAKNRDILLLMAAKMARPHSS